jgi:hypothetical protein
MFYDILVGGMMMYPLGITLDFWEKIVHTINQDGIGGYLQGFIASEIHYGTNRNIQQAQYVG